MIEQIKPFIPYILTYTPPIIMWIFTVYKMTKELPEVIKKLDGLYETTIKNDIAMLWSQLTSKCKKIIEANYCDIETMECIDQLFKRYKAIGGNHGVEAMVKQARAICKKTNK